MSEGYHIGDELETRPYDAGLMRRLLGYARPYRRLLILATVLLLLTALLGSIVPWLNWKVIAWYINNPDRLALQERAIAQPSPETQAALAAQSAHDRLRLLAMIGVTALLLLVEALMQYAQMMIIAFVGQKTMLKMRMDVFKHLNRMSLR
ncbi:MAG: hypothetical protein NTU83_02030, partial [Candidatus Hydrogenedentes bacterium]|nr:hypothetical protein [Candidatus Hydrogenedentota bacterium]